jgi:hypothetical protein
MQRKKVKYMVEIDGLEHDILDVASNYDLLHGCII